MGQKKSKAKKQNTDSTSAPSAAPTSVPEPIPIPKPVNIEPIKTPEPQSAQKTERIEEKSDSKSEFEETALMYTSRPNFNAPLSPRSQYGGTDNIVTAVSSYLAIAASQSRFRLSQPLPPPPKLQLLHDIPIQVVS